MVFTELTLTERTCFYQERLMDVSTDRSVQVDEESKVLLRLFRVKFFFFRLTAVPEALFVSVTPSQGVTTIYVASSIHISSLNGNEGLTFFFLLFFVCLFVL